MAPDVRGFCEGFPDKLHCGILDADLTAAAVGPRARSFTKAPLGRCFGLLGGMRFLFSTNATPHGVMKRGCAAMGSDSGTGRRTKGLAFDTNGNLYVSNIGNNTIEKFNSSGVGSQFNVTSDVNSPVGLAFYGGNLYVANAGDQTI
jgi:hypothetical protein